MSDDNATALLAVQAAVDDAVKEANRKRRALYEFVAETYSSPFVAMVAVLGCLEHLKELARQRGIDPDAFLRLYQVAIDTSKRGPGQQ